MNALHNVKISVKFAIVFVSLLVILCGGAILNEVVRTQIESTTERRNAIGDKVAMLNELGRDATGMVLAMRGLLLSGDRDNIATYERYAEEFDSSIQRLRTQATPLPESGPLLDELAQITADWRETARQQIDLMRRPLTVDHARLIEANGSGREFLSSFESTMSVLQAIAETEGEQALESQRNAALLSRISLSVGAVLGIAIAIAAYFTLTASISRPIARMTQVMSAMAKGDHDVTVTGLERRDEMGEMAQAMESFRSAQKEAARLRSEADAQQRAELARAERLRDLTKMFEADAEGMIRIVSTAASELENTATALNNSAAQSARYADSVAASSDETSQSVETVATATTELSASIAEISKQMANASELTVATHARATSTQSEIRALNEAAQKIGTVIGLIQEIAEQTNLLALNATIESARAGEAGKGFAVVANEVKALAGQTGKATEDISKQIKDVQERTNTAVRAIEEVAASIGNVQEVATAVASATDQQNSATNEISRNVEAVSAASREVNSSIGDVRDAAGRTGSASEQVLETASKLAEQAETLQARVTRFMEDVRAA